MGGMSSLGVSGVGGGGGPPAPSGDSGADCGWKVWLLTGAGSQARDDADSIGDEAWPAIAQIQLAHSGLHAAAAAAYRGRGGGGGTALRTATKQSLPSDEAARIDDRSRLSFSSFWRRPTRTRAMRAAHGDKRPGRGPAE
ncbi:hypothetical protein CDD83_1730 [Cordyceps sp. RAO-2017]|nr:hypothetical protein CDD83_1730 [Cordyceps sp. RAO-2017]